MPTAREIIDRIVILALQYGDSNQLAIAQAEFIEAYSHMIPKKYKGYHDYPCPDPETVKKQPNISE